MLKHKSNYNKEAKSNNSKLNSDSKGTKVAASDQGRAAYHVSINAIAKDSLTTIYEKNLTLEQSQKILAKEQKIKQSLALAREDFLNQKYKESHQRLVSAYAALNYIKPIETVSEQLAAMNFFYDLFLLEYILEIDKTKLNKAIQLLEEQAQAKGENPVYFVAKECLSQANRYYANKQLILFSDFHFIFMQLLRSAIDNSVYQRDQMIHAVKLINAMLAFHVNNTRTQDYYNQLKEGVLNLSINLVSLFFKKGDIVSCIRFCEQARILLKDLNLDIYNYPELLHAARTANHAWACECLKDRNPSAAAIYFKETIALDEIVLSRNINLEVVFSGAYMGVHTSLAVALFENGQTDEALKIIKIKRDQILPYARKFYKMSCTLLAVEAQFRYTCMDRELKNRNVAAALEHGALALELILKINQLIATPEERKGISALTDFSSTAENVSVLFYQVALDLAKDKKSLLTMEILNVAIAFCDRQNEKYLFGYLKSIYLTLTIMNLEDSVDRSAKIKRLILEANKITSKDDQKFESARSLVAKFDNSSQPVMLDLFKIKFKLGNELGAVKNKQQLDLIKIAEALKMADLDLKLPPVKPSLVMRNSPTDLEVKKSKPKRLSRNQSKPTMNLSPPLADDKENLEDLVKQDINKIHQAISKLEEMVTSYINQINDNKQAIVENSTSKYAKTYIDKHMNKIDKDLKSVVEKYSITDGLFRLKKTEGAVGSVEITQLEKSKIELAAMGVLQISIREHIEKLAKMNEMITETLALIESEVIVKNSTDKTKFTKKADDKKLSKDEKKAKKREEQLEHKKQRQAQPKPAFVKSALEIDTKTAIVKPKPVFFNSLSKESIKQKQALNRVFFHLIKLKVSIVDFESLIKENSDNKIFQEMRHYVLLLHITRIMQELKSYAEIQTATSQANEDESLNLRNMIMHAPCIAEPAEVLATAASITENLPQHLLTFRKEYSTDLVLDEKKQRELIGLYKMTDDADRYFASPFPLVIKSTPLYKKLASYHEQKMSTKVPENFAEQQIYCVLLPKIIDVAAIINKGYNAPVTAEDPKKEIRLSYYAHHFDTLKMLMAITGELSRHLKITYKLPQAIWLDIQKVRNEVGHSYSISPDVILKCANAISRNQEISTTSQRYTMWQSTTATAAAPTTAAAPIAKLNL